MRVPALGVVFTGAFCVCSLISSDVGPSRLLRSGFAVLRFRFIGCSVPSGAIHWPLPGNGRIFPVEQRRYCDKEERCCGIVIGEKIREEFNGVNGS